MLFVYNTFANNVLCLLYNIWKNINKEKYDDMCAALSLPSTNTSSALNAVLSGITVQSDKYQAGVGFG
jgi:hypothetical protein